MVITEDEARRRVQRPDAYSANYQWFKDTFTPRANQYVTEFLKNHPELSARLWCPNPTLVRGTRRDLETGGIIWHSERFAYLLTCHPVPEGASGHRRDVAYELQFAGEDKDHPIKLSGLYYVLNEKDQTAFGELAAQIMVDPICRERLWIPKVSLGVSQKENFPNWPPEAPTAAILYKFFPARPEEIAARSATPSMPAYSK